MLLNVESYIEDNRLYILNSTKEGSDVLMPYQFENILNEVISSEVIESLEGKKFKFDVNIGLTENDILEDATYEVFNIKLN